MKDACGAVAGQGRAALPAGGEKISQVKRSGNPTAPMFAKAGQYGEKTMMHSSIVLDPRRWKALRVSPTIANLHKGHAGVAVICADCLHGEGHANPRLRERFGRQWGLTLLEIEKKYRCEECGSRNARLSPWWGDGVAELGLQGPVAAR